MIAKFFLIMIIGVDHPVIIPAPYDTIKQCLDAGEAADTSGGFTQAARHHFCVQAPAAPKEVQ